MPFWDSDQALAQNKQMFILQFPWLINHIEYLQIYNKHLITEERCQLLDKYLSIKAGSCLFNNLVNINFSCQIMDFILDVFTTEMVQIALNVNFLL